MIIAAFRWVTARVPHECQRCNRHIQPNTQCWIQRLPDARRRRWKNVFTCSVCRPKKDAAPVKVVAPDNTQQETATPRQLSFL